MEKGKRLLGGTRLIAVMVAVLLAGAGVRALEGSTGENPQPAADVIVISGMKAFGRLERPPVVYRHDRHTEALSKQGKDCTVCHLKDDKKRVTPKFKRLEDADRDSTMRIYHDNCITCHSDTLARNEKAGPLTCGECHAKSPSAVSSWQPIGMDKSLHYRHVKAQKDKCSQCHHQYDEQNKKLIYVEGTEGSCRYCHKEEREENRIPLREASHLGCIACHQETLARKATAGPVDCSGCHDAERQLEIAEVDNVPRIKRGQPDAVFVKTAAKSNPAPQDAPRAKAVPFDHKAHETYNDTCRVCHHGSLSACAECHTVGGAKEGKFVNLEQAMHRLGADASCLGCHTSAQEDKSCAGCHDFIRKGLKKDTAACLTCHMADAPPAGGITGQPAESAAAAALLASRVPLRETYPDADIPEKVIINKLEKTYQPVEMPHRKIVRALAKGIGDSRLAAYYHMDQGTLCQGCHHNSPPAKKPPQCASCHGRPFEAGKPHTPGLLGAYHIQCMGCHQAMEIEKPAGCTECHKEK